MMLMVKINSKRNIKVLVNMEDTKRGIKSLTRMRVIIKSKMKNHTRENTKDIRLA